MTHGTKKQDERKEVAGLGLEGQGQRDDARKRRGRPPKPPEELLTQLTIRLPQKLKYGLELLARGQHRSLSQAIEWALQVGLNSFEVGSARRPLGKLVDRVWSDQVQGEANRMLALYHEAPELLEFDERAACELAERSREAQAIRAETELAREQSKLKVTKQTEERERALWDMHLAYYAFVVAAWPAITEAARRIANTGRETSGLGLLETLGIVIPDDSKVSQLDVMHGIARMARSFQDHPEAGEKWAELVDGVNFNVREHPQQFLHTVERLRRIDPAGTPAPRVPESEKPS